MDKHRNRFSSNIYMKAAALIAFGFLVLVFLFSGIISFVLEAEGCYDGTDHYAMTSEAMSYAAEDAFRAANYYYEIQGDNVSMNNIYGSNMTNLSLSIYSPDGSELLYRNKSDTDPVSSGSIYLYSFTHSDGEEADNNSLPNTYLDFSYAYDIDFSNISENHEIIYKIDYSLPAEMNIHDEYYYPSMYFDFLYAHKKTWIPTAIISALILIFITLFLFKGAGRRETDQEIHLNWIDRIPLDLLAGIVALLVFPLGIFLIDETAIGNGYRIINITPGYLILNIAMILAGFLPILYLVLGFLLSFATRVKAGKWYQNTLIALAFSASARIIKAIPSVLKTLAIYVAFWLLFIFFWAGYHPRMIHIFMIFLGGVTIIWLVYEIKQIQKASDALAKGDLDYKIDEKELFGSFRKTAEDLQSVRNGVSLAVEEQMKSERLKTELITNVSHDIKTPLTSIVNYVDLLQKAHTKEEEEQYLNVLARNSARLKKLIEDLVEASKASTGNITAEIVPTNVQEMISQAVGEYQDKLEAANLQTVITVQDPSLSVMADGKLLWRILSNLLSNCVKYAQSGTRVYIDALSMNNHVKITVKNTSRDALNVDPDELMERFVRGDKSRTTEGSGLGLNIARSLTELQNGTFTLSIDGDLFKAIITLPEAP